jgi:LPXTG-site transpeptidase (sortase) family protein
MRRALGSALIALGAALLLLAAARYAQGAFARDTARAAWDAAEARNSILDINTRIDRHGTETPVGLGAPVARLLIPSLGLDEVVVEGVGEAQLAAGPGHLPGSAWPGDSGNAIISAHRDRHFHGLDALAVGDTIITETLAGRASWVVVARRVVAREQPALFASREPELTLTTCWPVRYLGPAPDRLIITAKPLHHTTGA